MQIQAVGLGQTDLIVVAVYAFLIFGLAQFIGRDKAGERKDSADYFLASKSLPWWAIGASLIAANISAEQIIGMSGSGFAIGLAIASYEWMAAITLVLVAKYFLPIFLRNQIYTMPQFLELRYGGSVRLTLALFWIGVYVFVNLTSVLWLGALAVNTVTGLDLTLALIALGVFAGAYSLYGGLKSVALTDVIQVVLLIGGGLLITWIALDRISEGAGVLAGFQRLTTEFPEKFDMILSKDDPNYAALPGLSVLIGGMWIMNISYWGFNQYIIQRALAAKSLKEAQAGVIFAAFLKLLMPVIVVLPGIAALVLAPNLERPDQAYPTLMTLLPDGAKGLVFAALLAAIVSSLASMTNSVATIFTMDLYKHVAKGADERRLVGVGRITAAVALILAMVTARPLLGNFDQAFQYIQEFTGFFTPGIVVIFVLGMFWKKASSAGALAAALGSAALSFVFKVYWPDLPFMDRVGLVFLICLVGAVLISLVTPARAERAAVVTTEGVSFRTGPTFNLAAVCIALILAALYATWW
jgi:SSS family solute:Na+ symporter